MSWTNLSGVGAEPFLPETLHAEAASINAEVEAIVSDRAKVDELAEAAHTAWAQRVDHDRRPHFNARIAVLEREIAVRERIEVFYLARAQAMNERRAQAQETLRMIEQDARDLAGMPAPRPLPIGLLQSDPRWYAARQAVAACPAPDNGVSMDNANALAAARQSAAHFRDMIRRDEVERAERAKQASRDARAARERGELDDAHAERRDGLRAAVDRLLGRRRAVAETA